MIFLLIFFCCIFGPIAGQKRKDHDLNYQDCGKRNKPDTNLELGAFTSEPGNFPWHVAIYKYDKFAESYENICGGTIISPHVVLTAAQCVYDTANRSTYAPTFFRVVAGKMSFEWSTADSNAQEIMVNSIVIPATYLGDTSSYAENIAALNLAKDFVFNDLVMPVCWVPTRRRDNSPSRILQTAGWGLKGTERYSSTLKEANLEYISIVECRKKFTSIRYLRFINYDKLCVLTPKGRKDYDTGAGLVQKKGDRYYLMAILSANINNEFSPSTNITRHFDWLSRTVSTFNSQMRCNDGGFLCRDGTTCLKEEFVCDGIKHCSDGSDEISDSCPTPVTRDFSNARGSCKLPNQRSSVSYTRLNCQIDCEMKAGMYIRSNEIVRINCGIGFGPAADKHYDSKYICNNGTWFDREPECIRLCPPLKKAHLNFECAHAGAQINCDNYMRPGTVARFHCDKHYRPNYDPSSLTEVTTCLIGGTWSEKLPTCFPVCGLVNQVNQAVPTLSFANKTTYGEYPWHVAIYLKTDNRFNNICGGSLISEIFILTAAHCMFDPSTSEKFKAENLKVSAGKVKRDFYVKERYQVDSDVRDVITPDTYAGYQTRYEEDIALLRTVLTFTFNDFILPVCLDRFGTVQFHKNIRGLVIGWGLTEEHTYSDDLREVHLPIMPIVECRNLFQDFVQFITADKFCVIHQNHSGTQVGDSGGGMTFEVGGQHYIHGIVSIKKTDSNDFSVFTNVTEHLRWIFNSMKTFST
ncbi:hypothetical protein O3M35_006482 [Rhynocoris fuscipes]|uniref:Uncharacterized protein n=1 Tax=Rhynocoris fuscipes TaxID=488301 RepID=A0AAW1DGD3_9HEMI